MKDKHSTRSMCSENNILDVNFLLLLLLLVAGLNLDLMQAKQVLYHLAIAPDVIKTYFKK